MFSVVVRVCVPVLRACVAYLPTSLLSHPVASARLLRFRIAVQIVITPLRTGVVDVTSYVCVCCVAVPSWVVTGSQFLPSHLSLCFQWCGWQVGILDCSTDQSDYFFSPLTWCPPAEITNFSLLEIKPAAQVLQRVCKDLSLPPPDKPAIVPPPPTSTTKRVGRG